MVLSDSHSALRFMRKCVDTLRPDVMIHLGDYYDDAQVLAEEYPHIPLHRVPGNCDRYRCPEYIHRMLCYKVGVVMLYMTHGHNERVKSGVGLLVAKARLYGAQAALYGHTHQWDCHKEGKLWVINPGSCGYGGGTAALLNVAEGEICSCEKITEEKLEELQ